MTLLQHNIIILDVFMKLFCTSVHGYNIFLKETKTYNFAAFCFRRQLGINSNPSRR